jgi:DNA-binding transcriptional LysR family regulator
LYHFSGLSLCRRGPATVLAFSLRPGHTLALALKHDLPLELRKNGVVRLGLPEDFAAYRLPELLSSYVRSRPGLRLDVRCGLSVEMRRALERGELDLALFKRDAGDGAAKAAWPEQLHWVTSRRHPVDFRRDPLPLVMFEQGCLYRARMIHAVESAGRAWHIAYTSPNLPGIQAAVSAGLGVSILPTVAITADHRVLKAAEGYPAIANTVIALVVAAGASPAIHRLAGLGSP